MKKIKDFITSIFYSISFGILVGFVSSIIIYPLIGDLLNCSYYVFLLRLIIILSIGFLLFSYSKIENINDFKVNWKKK